MCVRRKNSGSAAISRSGKGAGWIRKNHQKYRVANSLLVCAYMVVVGADLKPERLVEADRSTHVVGSECDGAQPLDHGATLILLLQGSARPWEPGSKPGK